jgi:hypothetical protein
MKKSLIILVLAIVFASCEVIVVDPDYGYQTSIVGSYEVDEYSQTYNKYFAYTIDVRRSSYNNSVLIDNFYNEGITVRAEINGSQLYIPLQTVQGYRVEGSGNIYSNEINLTYKVTDTYSSTRTDFCEATLFRMW